MMKPWPREMEEFTRGHTEGVRPQPASAHTQLLLCSQVPLRIRARHLIGTPHQYLSLLVGWLVVGLFFAFYLFTLHPFTAPLPSTSPTILPLCPLPFSSSGWGPSGYPPTLALQISASLDVSSHTESRQDSSDRRTYSTDRQQILG